MKKVAVTGVSGYTGRYIARRLLEEGHPVITLTGQPERLSPFGERVPAFPFNFDRPEALAASLRGVNTLFNTYWVRFDYGQTSFRQAIDNTCTLIQAAAEAGVRRIVHISITQPSPDSPLPYFQGKWQVEQAVKLSGLSYAILRPTVVFGKEDILINNIAYLLHRFPLFAIPGSGDYRLQPVYVEDMAEVAVQAGKRDANQVLDVAGPEIFTFEELVRLIAAKIHRRVWQVRLPAGLALLLAQLLGRFLGDVLLTRDELRGLMGNLLVSREPPLGTTRLGDWLEANAETVGSRYASELERHYRRKSPEPAG